jgi:hypothetical protein
MKNLGESLSSDAVVEGDGRGLTRSPNREDEFTMFGTTFRGPKIIRTPATEDAKPHFRRSLFAAAFAPPILLLPLLGSDLTIPAALALVVPAAYAGWAIYWGFVGIGNLMLREEEGEVSPGWQKIIHAMLHGLGEHPAAIAVIAVLYSACGGGIREFLKYRRIVSHPSLE